MRSQTQASPPGLIKAGFIDPEVVLTYEAVPGMHGAIVRAVKPVGAGRATDSERGKN